MYLERCIVGGLWAVVLAAPVGALAKQPEPGPNQGSHAGEALSGTAREGAPEKAAPRAVAEFGRVADADGLERARGGSDGIASYTALSGTVSGNAASYVVTGANVIQSGSFANVAGIPMVIQNSGANVLIQNATVINLQLK